MQILILNWIDQGDNWIDTDNLIIFSRVSEFLPGFRKYTFLSLRLKLCLIV